jgi:hypothetical protein
MRLLPGVQPQTGRKDMPGKPVLAFFRGLAPQHDGLRWQDHGPVLLGHVRFWLLSCQRHIHVHHKRDLCWDLSPVFAHPVRRRACPRHYGWRLYRLRCWNGYRRRVYCFVPVGRIHGHPRYICCLRSPVMAIAVLYHALVYKGQVSISWDTVRFGPRRRHVYVRLGRNLVGLSRLCVHQEWPGVEIESASGSFLLLLLKKEGGKVWCVEAFTGLHTHHSALPPRRRLRTRQPRYR